MSSTVEGPKMEYTKSPLELLDELDEFRRGHQDERRDWNEVLSANPSTRYHRDLQDPASRIRF